MEKFAAMGREEMISQLERLIEQAKAGNVRCAAFRVFKADGTWEDVAVGGSEEERAEALRKLHEQH